MSDTSNSYSEFYQDFDEPEVRTPLWDVFRTIWEAERKFNLVFRQDLGVHVWAANRVRFYYDLSKALGLYDQQAAPQAEVPSRYDYEEGGNPFSEADIYIESGALGPSAKNRAREYGCVYTERFIKPLLERNKKILLLHDDPDRLVQHENLTSITTVEHSGLMRFLAGKWRLPKTELNEEAIEFWNSVNAFFQSQLGVELRDAEGFHKLIRSFKQQFEWQSNFLRMVNPKAMILMTHYFRGAQIDAARKLKIRSFDYQHGLNSRFHLGYGYPNVAEEHRTPPYFPDEYLCWGPVWAPEKWFPTKNSFVRNLGYYSSFDAPDKQEDAKTAPVAQNEDRDHTILVATSWAMQTIFSQFVEALALRKPSMTILVKCHPREDISAYEAALGKFSNVKFLSGDVDILAAARTAKYVVSICSSSLFDSLQEGCKIGAIHSQAVEYIDDFIKQFDVPVITQDAGNIDQALALMDSQSIPVELVHHPVTQNEWEFFFDSLELDGASLLPPVPKSTPLFQKNDLSKKAKKYNADLQALEEAVEKDKRKIFYLKGLENWFWATKMSHYRRTHRLEYDRLLRTELDTIPENKHFEAIKTAISEGMPLARYRVTLNDLLKKRILEGDRDGARQILKLVFSDTSDSSKSFRAHVFEHYVTHFKETSKSKTYYWKEALALFSSLSTTTRRLADSYRDIATAAKTQYADYRISEFEQGELKREILDKLQRHENFTMLRIGDGEVYAFDVDYVASGVQQADRDRRERLWWSQTMSEDIRQRLRRDAEDAFTRVDMLGIPSIYRLMRDMPLAIHATVNPIENWPSTMRTHVILYKELDRLAKSGQLDWSQKVLLDDRCHQDLFISKHMKDFHQEGRSNVLVSCFTKDEINKSLGFEMFTNDVRLPPHSMVKDNVQKDEMAAQATPHLLDSLLEQIDDLASLDPVFYVGGGFVGKILIGRIAKNGGTALDIGASADYWMQVFTRGELDFLHYGRQ
ncbi:hypothetical protein [uncultured Cohaesibacter sp.]|uniref:hypothetical protein n=1 Tax=uncultured Cohaesibacter sp. TaxID=1002546 RepID=UPI00292FD153|nr:hypothetical protein [uncultured Cohaesibacter sp.]